MTDPITLYAAKVAVVAMTGTVAALWGAFVQSPTSDGVTSWASIGAGVAVLAAGTWKLLADHTAVENERSTMSGRVRALEAERDEWRARWEAEHEHCQRIEVEAARLGIALPRIGPDLEP